MNRLARAVAIPLVALAAWAGAAEKHRHVLSVPSLEIKKTERVKSFELEVKNGLIRGLPRIPSPWKVEIENDDNGTARLKATSRSGTAEVKAAFFTDFVEVELWDAASVQLRVTTTENWEDVARRLTFDDGEIVRRLM